MRKVILFIAMSLDGYIAGTSGNVDWLHGENPSSEDMVSYNEFVKNIDTVVMGWNTYHQIVTDLSPDEWMYSDMTSYILTHKKLPSEKNINFIHEDICCFIRSIRQKSGKDIWICGGPTIIQPLIREELIDRFHISIIPVILGNGIRLFEPSDKKTDLKLVKTQNYNGITDIVYELR